MKRSALGAIMLGVAGGLIVVVSAYFLSPYAAFMTVGAFLIYGAYELTNDDTGRPPGR